MNRLSLLLLVLFLTVSLIGCSTGQKRRDELRAKHPAMSEEKLEKLAQGIVEVGMTKDEVREALNNIPPYHRHIEGDRWTYVEHVMSGQEGRQELGKILIFENGRVAKIREFLRFEGVPGLTEY